MSQAIPQRLWITPYFSASPVTRIGSLKNIWGCIHYQSSLLCIVGSFWEITSQRQFRAFMEYIITETIQSLQRLGKLRKHYTFVLAYEQKIERVSKTACKENIESHQFHRRIWQLYIKQVQRIRKGSRLSSFSNHGFKKSKSN